MPSPHLAALAAHLDVPVSHLAFLDAFPDADLEHLDRAVADVREQDDAAVASGLAGAVELVPRPLRGRAKTLLGGDG